MKLDIEIEVIESDGWFVATAIDIPGVNAQARTRAEVIENALEAAVSIMTLNREALRDSGARFSTEKIVVDLPDLPQGDGQ